MYKDENIKLNKFLGYVFNTPKELSQLFKINQIIHSSKNGI